MPIPTVKTSKPVSDKEDLADGADLGADRHVPDLPANQVGVCGAKETEGEAEYVQAEHSEADSDRHFGKARRAPASSQGRGGNKADEGQRRCNERQAESQYELASALEDKIAWHGRPSLSKPTFKGKKAAAAGRDLCNAVDRDATYDNSPQRDRRDPHHPRNDSAHGDSVPRGRRQTLTNLSGPTWRYSPHGLGPCVVVTLRLIPAEHEPMRVT